VRRITIGRYSDTLTTDQARGTAKDMAYDVHVGRDPMGEKQARRQSATLNELLDDYIDSEAFASKAESTRKIDLGRIERHIRPLLGKEYAHKITTEAVKRMRRAITEGKTAGRIKTKYRGLARVTGGTGTADKAVLLLSAAFKWAVEQKIVSDNPAADIKCWKTGTRDTILDDAEDYKRMFEALQDLENEKRIRSAAADAIRFIALTGARRGEVTGLRWRYVDLKQSQVVLPPKAHKTGHKTGKPRIIALPAEAQAIITRQPPGEPDEYVFRSTITGSPIALNTDWPKVRSRAKLPASLGLHGLRHSIGTHFAMQGASAVELMELLGHKQIETTLRYIHYAENARKTIAERAASIAMAGLNAKDEKPKPA
jgi:integrase